MKLERWILVGFAAGVVVGFIARADAMIPLREILLALEPIGTAFIRLITMVVVPLVIASVFVGVASLGDIRALGRIGGRTLAYFLATTFAAALIGLTVSLASGVGTGLGEIDRTALLARVSPGSAMPTAPISVGQTLINMIPQNPFASAAQGGGDLLPLIIAVVIFAAAATVADDAKRQPVVAFFAGVNEVSMIVIGWLMKLAPIAVFVLIAATVARFGATLLVELLAFCGVAIAALAIHVGIILTPALVLGARERLGRFVRATSDALLLAFSTASSNATLPVSMAAARNRLGISDNVIGFVLPPGASLNKNGSAAYKAVAAVFIAHLYGLSLSPSMCIAIVLMATVAAFAGAGVPGSSLVTTLIVLNAIGLGPRAAAGIALVTAVDRPLDMCRSAVNTFSNLVGAAWVSRSLARGERI